MKNYFNKEESSNHLILMSAMISCQNLIESSAPTTDEIKLLKKAMKCVSDFSESVYNRMGEGYKKSLKNKAMLNTLRLVARNTSATNTKMEDVVDIEILRDLISQNSDIDCQLCNRLDCKSCIIYKIKSYLHIEGKNLDNSLCPFRLEKIDNSFDFFGDE